MEFKNKRAIIIGAGISGRGAESALAARGAKVTVVQTEGIPECAKNAELIIVSPGVRQTHPIFAYAALHGIPLRGEVGLAAELNDKPIIGITGTNGKTTTVDMLGGIYEAAGVSAAVCGNIGESFAAAAERGGYQRAIVELSSFQLLNARPLHVHIACITSFDRDHLNYHGSMFEYRLSKLKIGDGQTEDDYLIIPKGFSVTGRSGCGRVLTIGCDAELSNGSLYIFGKRLIGCSDIRAKGRHNHLNALNAALVAYLDGIPTDAIARGLAQIDVRPHRIALVGEYNGTSYFNDSKGTNVSATLAAAQCMTGTTALIVGGSGKSCGYDDLFARLSDGVIAVFCVGENADEMLRAAANCGYKSALRCGDLGEAVERASLSGACNVLFSPASASFDKYSSYAERGTAFEREVQRLSGN